MILFCYFQAKPMEQIAFSFPWKEVLSELEADFHVVEADGQSEAFLIQEIARMITESEETICFFDVMDAENLGALSKAIEALRKNKASQLFILNGENERLEKVLKMLKQPILKFESASQLKAALSEFISA